MIGADLPRDVRHLNITTLQTIANLRDPLPPPKGGDRG